MLSIINSSNSVTLRNQQKKQQKYIFVIKIITTRIINSCLSFIAIIKLFQLSFSKTFPKKKK